MHFILASLSTSALISLSLFTFLIFLKSETIARMLDNEEQNWVINIFLSLAAIAFLISIFKGVEALLYWVPNSLGHVGQDGDWITGKTIIAAPFFGAIGLTLIQILVDAPKNSFLNRINSLENREYLKIINRLDSISMLESLEIEYSQKCDELNNIIGNSYKKGITRWTSEGAELASYKHLHETVKATKSRLKKLST